eukprot:gene8476-9968_t
MLGLKKGDRIGIWSTNRVEWLVTQFASARIGAILVNINTAYRLSELEYALNKVSINALVTEASFKSSNYIGMLQTLIPELASMAPHSTSIKSAKIPSLRTIIRMGDEVTPGMVNYASVGREVPPANLAIMPVNGSLDAIKLDSHDAINIQFTSGTTGSPKGATLTHCNVVNNGRFVAMAMRLTQRDRLCVPVPLYHCFGMVLAVMAAVSTGACMVFPSHVFDPLATMRAVSSEQCTALHGVPTMFIAQLDHPEFGSFDFSRLRTGIMAGSPCPIEVMRRVVETMNMKEVTIAYGMTETSPVSFQSSYDDDFDKRVTTVGQIQPHLEARLVDASGEVVKVGETGEIQTKGYSVMKGYWDDEERTRESIHDSWMHTGDLATLDSEGYCNIIEEYLFRHPKVQSAQVFGVPDVKFGEEVCVWIILKRDQTCTEDEIRSFCQGQISHYKIPRYIRFVEHLPMTVTGKIQKQNKISKSASPQDFSVAACFPFHPTQINYFHYGLTVMYDAIRHHIKRMGRGTWRALTSAVLPVNLTHMAVDEPWRFYCDVCRMPFIHLHHYNRHIKESQTHRAKANPRPAVIRIVDKMKIRDLLDHENGASDAFKKMIYKLLGEDKVSNQDQFAEFTKDRVATFITKDSDKSCMGVYLRLLDVIRDLIKEHKLENCNDRIILKFAFDACRVTNANSHHIVSGTIEIIDTSRPLRELKSPYNNKPFVFYLAKESYEIFESKLKVLVAEINMLYETGTMNIEGHDYLFDVKFTNDYLGSTELQGTVNFFSPRNSQLVQ